MENNGKVNISGYINPTLLLKCLEKAGKTAEIVHWEYGECSSNLFEKTESPLPLPPINNNGYPPNYNYNYRRRRNYAFNHLECAGNASECCGHHIQNPITPIKSSSSQTHFQKLASGHPPCCSLMWRISSK